MDRLFGLDKVSPHDDCCELLTTVYGNVELSVLRSILDGEEIPYLIRERGSGSAVKLIVGFSTLGTTDVFVPTAALEHAKEVLEAFRNGEPVEESTEEEATE